MPQDVVFSTEFPEYPFLMYNHETRRTMPATDKEHRGKLEKEGWVEEPFGPQDPDSLTQQEVQDLQALLAKAAKALAKLGKLSEDKAPEPVKATPAAKAK
jgi:hypothetical protein